MINASEITAIAGSAGFIAGHGFDYLVAKRATRGEMPDAVAYGDANEFALESLNGDETTPEHTSVAQYAGALLMKNGLPLTVAAAAALNVYAWMPDQVPTDEARATLEIVVDHSGATTISETNKKPAVETIDSTVKLFADSNLFNAKAVVSSEGEQTPMKLTEVSGKEAFGAANLNAAANLAFNSIKESQAKNIDKSGKPTAGIVVLTNGNDIGNPDSILAKTDQKIGATSVQTPLFVFNVADKTNNQIEKNLKVIAKKSGGRYWDIKSAKPGTFTQDINKLLADGAPEQENNGQDKLIQKSIGGLLLAGVIGLGVSRRRYIIGRGPDAFVKRKKEK